MKITMNHIASSLLFLVAIGGAAQQTIASPTSDNDGASDAAEEKEEPVPEDERLCFRLNNPSADVTPALCTFTVEPGTGTGAGGNGCAIGFWKVTDASCSSQVETFPDDACNGEAGTCKPPKVSATALKSITTTAKPSLAVGECINPDAALCTCNTTGGKKTYTYGRKVCS